MGDPSARAVTTTPSIGPSSSEMTSPVSATPACACSGDQSDPAWIRRAANPKTVRSNRFFRMTPPPLERQPEAHLRRAVLGIDMPQVLRRRAFLDADVPVRPVEDVEDFFD